MRVVRCQRRVLVLFTGESAHVLRYSFLDPCGCNKDVIVIDVRGNPGGTYAWFAAFLRELYGPDYADYYARARLEIRNVMMSLPIPGSDNPGFSAEQNALRQRLSLVHGRDDAFPRRNTDRNGTHIDRRSGGWPGRVQLPSGIAHVGMGGRMVRENRKRGENETWVPTYRFPGDITDTPAVQRWITDFVLKQDAR